VAVISDLDPKQPTATKLLGMDLVIWRDGGEPLNRKHSFVSYLAIDPIACILEGAGRMLALGMVLLTLQGWSDST
jgi:hypothetical protein